MTYAHEQPKKPEIIVPDESLPPHPEMPFIFGPKNTPRPIPCKTDEHGFNAEAVCLKCKRTLGELMLDRKPS